MTKKYVVSKAIDKNSPESFYVYKHKPGFILSVDASDDKKALAAIARGIVYIEVLDLKTDEYDSFISAGECCEFNVIEEKYGQGKHKELMSRIKNIQETISGIEIITNGYVLDKMVH